MEKRPLGKTGLDVSVLGFGGFHLVEITSELAAHLLGAYLDAGGSYIETAPSYGNGISETKIGRSVSHRRRDYILATKSMERTRAGFLAELDKSLRNLKTDHVDLMFMHGVQAVQDMDRILGPDGAMEAAIGARQAGKIRFIAISGHGRPDAMLDAVRRYRFDVLMTGFNYLDRFNYPSIEGELLPTCIERGTGVIAMKALGDGFLYRSPEPALRYALSLPVATAVAGINSKQMLDTDLAIVSRFAPMTEEEKQELYRTAPELGDYVCRLCDKCRTAEFDPQKVFLLEGMFDRQMDDMRVSDTARYALQERLKQWFAQGEKARSEYSALTPKVDPSRSYRELSALCPYRIDVDRKLKIAHGKLAPESYIA
jgi:predicted aldo/keto reductase-like oxidoreductase